MKDFINWTTETISIKESRARLPKHNKNIRCFHRCIKRVNLKKNRKIPAQTEKTAKRIKLIYDLLIGTSGCYFWEGKHQITSFRLSRAILSQNPRGTWIAGFGQA